MTRLALLALLALAACQTGRPGELPPVGEEKVALDRAACERRGGRFGPVGRAGLLVCTEQTRDAGRACETSTDCESACLARSRTCAPIKPLFGCQDILNAAGLRLTQCID